MTLSSKGSFQVVSDASDELVIAFKGRLDVWSSGTLLKKISKHLKTSPSQNLLLDFSGVSYFDEYGALLVCALKRRLTDQSDGRLKINDPAGMVLPTVNRIEQQQQKPTETVPTYTISNPIAQLGGRTLAVISSLVRQIEFLGATALAFLHVLKRPRSLRFGDFVTFMEKTGVNALPIVGLISFLLGLVIAFMSSLQLAQFGANIYVASLVSIAMVSELGPIMTAIVVAGRSGSAYAAEIGTMKITEEIDALTVMGFDAVLFLVVPRMLAALIVIPILTFFSDIFAILGGLLVGVTLLDLTANAYLSQTWKALSLFEVGWGASKSVVFALIISWIGCLRGFETRGGADAVGNAATSAVVTSIFLIILFDSAFAIIRSYFS
jgi:phospholipid/cholesterol/gamma-HCH transport system permease protein